MVGVSREWSGITVTQKTQFCAQALIKNIFIIRYDEVTWKTHTFFFCEARWFLNTLKKIFSQPGNAFQWCCKWRLLLTLYKGFISLGLERANHFCREAEHFLSLHFFKLQVFMVKKNTENPWALGDQSKPPFLGISINKKCPVYWKSCFGFLLLIYLIVKSKQKTYLLTHIW